jgi:uncharacterized protein YjbK
MAHEEFEFKFRVESGDDLDRLIAAVARGSTEVPSPVTQVNHFFDTPDGSLRRGRMALRLREESGRFFLTAKGPERCRSEGDPLTVKAEEEVVVTANEARAILAGREYPLALLGERLGAPRPPLLEAMHTAVGPASLREVGAFRNERRRVGPVPLSTKAGVLDVVFELDRTEFPPAGDLDELHFEIEVELPGERAEICRDALLELLAGAGIAWRHSTSKARRLFERLDLPSD